MRFAGLFLVLAVAAWGAEAERGPMLTRVSVRTVQIDPALVLPLAGVDEALLRRRLDGELRRAGVPSGDPERAGGRGWLEVLVEGGYIRPKSVSYRVSVVLKGPAPADEKTAASPMTLGQSMAEGEASPTALAIQVVIAMEDQVAELVRQHVQMRAVAART